MKFGLLFRLESWWIGIHWSPYNRRFCINLIPMLTFWIAVKGGIAPDKGHDIFRNDRPKTTSQPVMGPEQFWALHYPHEF